ncbi:MAG: dTDP-4-dehydrorhamnose reductase [Candidatus Cloacimonetes bacterium]|nr:dTDP-4-dehydrorhamnose reductase [Candidatus Cloacimonadota bacterium]
MPKYLITGKNGMLAYALRIHPRFEDHVAFSHNEMEIGNYLECYERIAKVRPEIVINSAAFTDVANAEFDSETAFLTNAEGPRNLADICKKLGIKLVHFSTDYVFPGRKSGNYTEYDETLPVNRYGSSKLEGEKLVKQESEDALIIRVSLMYGENGHNFVSTISRYLLKREEVNVVADQFSKTTWTMDAALATHNLIQREASGIFHFANDGVCSRFEFTKEIARLLQQSGKKVAVVRPISVAAYDDSTPRPTNSSMNTAKYKNFTKAEIQPWQHSLAEYMESAGLLE